MPTILPLGAFYIFLALGLWGCLVWQYTLRTGGLLPAVWQTVAIARRLKAVNWNGDDDKAGEPGTPTPPAPPPGSQS